MYTYNITYNDTENPSIFMQGCHITANSITEMSEKFHQLHPTGFIYGMVVLQ